ncbi:hypothetical protein ACF8LF_21510 [Pseudomonas putida]
MLKTSFKNKLLKTRKKDFKNARGARAEADFFFFERQKRKAEKRKASQGA